MARTAHAVGALRATRPIAVRPRRALAVPTALPTTLLIRSRVQIIARRGPVQAPPSMAVPMVAVALTRHRGTRPPTIAVIRRKVLVRIRRLHEPTLLRAAATP